MKHSRCVILESSIVILFKMIPEGEINFFFQFSLAMNLWHLTLLCVSTSFVDFCIVAFLQHEAPALHCAAEQHLRGKAAVLLSLMFQCDLI